MTLKFKKLAIDTNLFTGECNTEDEFNNAVKFLTIQGGHTIIEVFNLLKQVSSTGNIPLFKFDFSSGGQTLIEYLTN